MRTSPRALLIHISGSGYVAPASHISDAGVRDPARARVRWCRASPEPLVASVAGSAMLSLVSRVARHKPGPGPARRVHGARNIAMLNAIGDVVAAGTWPGSIVEAERDHSRAWVALRWPDEA